MSLKHVSAPIVSLLLILATVAMSATNYTTGFVVSLAGLWGLQNTVSLSLKEPIGSYKHSLRTRRHQSLGAVSFPGFGFLYSVIALLIVIPMAMISGWEWGLYPHSVGLEVRITKPATIIAETEGRIILAIHCAKGRTPAPNELELRLNSRPVSEGDLRTALRAELSRRAHRVIYVDGEGA